MVTVLVIVSAQQVLIAVVTSPLGPGTETEVKL